MESLFQKKEKKPKKKKKKATGKAGGKVKVFGDFFDARGKGHRRSKKLSKPGGFDLDC